jgi:hypothetical protein
MADHAHRGEPGFHEQAHAWDAKSGGDPYKDKGWFWTEERERLKDTDPSTFKTDRERFDDLHARVQLMNHQMDAIFHDLDQLRGLMDQQQTQTLEWLSPIHDYVAQTKNMQERLELVVGEIRNNVELKEFKANLEEMRQLIGQSHQTVMEHLPLAVHTGEFGRNRSSRNQLTDCSSGYTCRSENGILCVHGDCLSSDVAGKLCHLQEEEGYATEEVLVMENEDVYSI